MSDLSVSIQNSTLNAALSLGPRGDVGPVGPTSDYALIARFMKESISASASGIYTLGTNNSGKIFVPTYVQFVSSSTYDPAIIISARIEFGSIPILNQTISSLAGPSRSIVIVLANNGVLLQDGDDASLEITMTGTGQGTIACYLFGIYI